MTAPAGSTEQRLALGTVQFGLDYGITNAHGRLAGEAARSLLGLAWDHGVRTLDTAQAYGRSEAELGQAFATQPGRAWRIVTKTLPLRVPQVGPGQVADVDAAFQRSLQLLAPARVDTLLVHHADDLLVPGGERLHAWLRQQQADGRAARIGASVYDAEQVDRLLQRYRLDVVQLPASIADQRLVRDGSVARLAAADVEVHVRSLYLQGLLLASPETLAARFPGQAAWARRFHAECARRGVTPLQACLAFFRAEPGFRVAVLGAAAPDEFAATLAAWEGTPAMDWSGWAVDNPGFTDPRQWTTA